MTFATSSTYLHHRVGRFPAAKTRKLQYSKSQPARARRNAIFSSIATRHHDFNL
jgi:hypothetical protein